MFRVCTSVQKVYWLPVQWIAGAYFSGGKAAAT
jgi:hypothetical protein